jgi:hypothetical protein
LKIAWEEVRTLGVAGIQHVRGSGGSLCYSEDHCVCPQPNRRCCPSRGPPELLHTSGCSPAPRTSMTSRATVAGQWVRDLRLLSVQRRTQPCLCLRLCFTLLGRYSFPRALPRACCGALRPQASGSPSQSPGCSHLTPNSAADLPKGPNKDPVLTAMSSCLLHGVVSSPPHSIPSS